MNYKECFSLINKGIVVTGGAGYLGREIVNGLLDFGAKVLIAEISEMDKNTIVSNEEYRDNLFIKKCDLDSTESIKEMYCYAEQCMGHIDGLITCAAKRGAGVMEDIEDMGDEYWQEGIDGTVGYTFRTIREALPFMKKSGGGSIVNISSMYGLISPDPRTYFDTEFSSTPNYGAGKAATIELTRFSAAYLAKYNIRVNAISPGSFPHPKVQENQLFKKRLEDKTMLGRVGEPKDLVGVSVFLLSEASSYMTGANIIVDGGQTAW